MAGQGELRQTPSKQRAPALGLLDGSRAHLNSLLGRGSGGISLHPFICLHIRGCFFPLEKFPRIISPSGEQPLGLWRCGGDSSRGTRAARKRREAEQQRSRSHRLWGRGGLLIRKASF